MNYHVNYYFVNLGYHLRSGYSCYKIGEYNILKRKTNSMNILHTLFGNK